MKLDETEKQVEEKTNSTARTFRSLSRSLLLDHFCNCSLNLASRAAGHVASCTSHSYPLLHPLILGLGSPGLGNVTMPGWKCTVAFPGLLPSCLPRILRAWAHSKATENTVTDADGTTSYQLTEELLQSRIATPPLPHTETPMHTHTHRDTCTHK